VWIEDSPWSNAFPFAAGEIEDCEAVVLRNAQFGICCLGGFTPALEIRRSKVALYEGSARGENVGSSPTGVPGGAGIYVADSRVTLYASTFFGGKGSDPVFGGFPGSGGPALVASGATTLVELVGTTLTGGPGGKGPTSMGATGPAMVTQNGAMVLVRPGRAHLLTTPSPVDSGAPTMASFQGDPGDLVYVFVSTSPGPLTFTGKWSGPLVLPVPSFHFFVGVVPGTGPLSASFVAPTLAPGDLVESFHLQPVFLGGGEIAFGTPTQVRVLDPSL
jgi:hypothetical protein